MKRAVGQGVIVILAFILQNTICTTLSLNGVKPNLLLIIAVFYGFTTGINSGMLTGFFCGFLCDIFFGPYIGVYSFLFMLLGGMGGIMAKSFYQDDIIFPYVTIAAADGLFSFVYYVFMFLIRGRYDFDTYLTTIIMPEILYTLVASLILLPVLHRYNKLLDKLVLVKEKESDV